MHHNLGHQLFLLWPGSLSRHLSGGVRIQKAITTNVYILPTSLFDEHANHKAEIIIQAQTGYEDEFLRSQVKIPTLLVHRLWHSVSLTIWICIVFKVLL